MLVQKILEIGINIDNPINVLRDPTNIHRLIARKLEGRCYKGCYIHRVEEIVKMGDCLINQEGPASVGIMSVMFRVLAEVFMAEEIINGCEIITRDPSGILICKKNNAIVTLAKNPILESLKPGDIISVRVGNVRYTVGADKVAINAIPYIPDANFTVYAIDPTKVDESRLEDVQARILSEQELAAELRNGMETAKAWDTFAKLLEPYRNPPPLPKGAKKIDLFAKLPAGIKYICRDPRAGLAEPFAVVYTEMPPEIINPQVEPVVKLRDDLGATEVMVIMLEDYCSHLRTIREMVNIYNTEELVRRHKNLWAIYNKYKK